MGRHPKSRLQMSDSEIVRAFQGSDYPPILSADQAARLAGVSKKTLYDWSCRGLLQGIAVRRGKRLRVLRDRFVRFLFSEQG